MIYHCIRFAVKPGVSAADRDAALDQLKTYKDAIPSIRSHIVGPDFGGEYEFGAVTVIGDLDGYAEYMNHPAHLEMDRVGLPLIDRFMSYDITDDPDPEFGAKIAEIHQRRYDDQPDIAGLVSDLGEYTGSAAPGKHGTAQA
ncbi:Dabb family protein [Amycolatopsis suaedae]|uniref:Dabb family protein n=1 Tax=Amycolatopsis suaedae TaxID=2510978 RepID=A0A4Q7J4K2_9PSEU|nr:Dabb family protein [Amycolatopsis suaedae]RZQ61937.1 Dabb family protein [Amycolatopsis suaedae]